MNSVLPGWRAALLLIRLRLRRLVNLTLAMGLRRRGPATTAASADSALGSRRATAPKRRGRWLVSLLIVGLMVFAYTNLAHQAIAHLVHDFGVSDDDAEPIVTGIATLGPQLVAALQLELTLLAVSAILMTVGSRELSQPDWDMEWLVTLPLRTDALLWARLAERTVANPVGVMALWPICSLIAHRSGYTIAAAVGLGLGAALPLLALTALGRTLIDTGLRLKLAPAALRNLQATVSLASMAVFYLAISPALAAGSRFIAPLLGHWPPVMAWSPPGLAVRMLASPDHTQAALAALLLVIETAAALAAGVALLAWMLRHGVQAAGVRESARGAKPRPSRQSPRNAHNRPIHWGRWLSPVQRRELTLLSRDRNFLVQTLVLPLVIVASQWILNGRVHSLRDLGASPITVAVASFTVAAYALMLSAFQTLNSEGGALWLLYTFPQSMEAVLRQKARLWAALALLYPLAGFAMQVGFAGWPDAAGLGRMAMVLLSVPIYAAIATAMGVLACDPLAQDARQRLRPTQVYLYMMLAGIYAFAISAGVWWRSLVLLVMVILLAQALWQKARDELPCLLDPAANPPPRVSTADGLIAAMLFFVIQTVAMLIMKSDDRAAFGREVLLSYVAAGALTFALVRYVQWRARTEGVPAIFGDATVADALRQGALYGAAAAVLGLAYLAALHRWGLPDWLPRNSSKELPALGGWIYPLAVLAAPLFEEFIFRGLVFRGLRRSWSWLPSAGASAAVFAAVHPPLSMLPVFVLGLCAARAYERSGVLLAPMVTHALYNAVIVAASMP